MPVSCKQLKDIMAKVAPGLPYVVQETEQDFLSFLRGESASAPNMSTTWHSEDCSFYRFEIDPLLLTVAPNVESVAMVASHEYGHYMLKACNKYGPDEEIRADLFGYAHMLKVGYDPRNAVEMWGVITRWMSERGLTHNPSEHPSGEARTKTMLEWIEQNRVAIETQFGRGVNQHL